MITAERWQQIKKLFHAALERAPEDRASFLSELCSSDESIRREVESLISAHEKDGSFLNEPAYEIAAEMLTASKPGLTAGKRIGPHKILSTLGVGGMGEVYLAQDMRLGRKIALKLLPAGFDRDEQRVRRFEQEARAASALNHPNVCVIHEIGKTDDGRHFIAMEYVDGVTLRQRMAQKRLKLNEALDAAAQIAAALIAAHAAGIVHRDIKPENIMLRSDGYVKVLDFGLAKLNQNLSKPQDVHEASTIARAHTMPGMLMGTVKYMSPEQLRELQVDERTDIWSLGVVLHEMLTGITPFEARTTNETIALILDRQPPGVALHSDEVPAELQRILRKALSKKRRERYQTVKDLAADLKQLRRQLEIEATPELSVEPISSRGAAVGGERLEMVSSGNGSATLHKTKSHVLSTAEYILSEIKEHKKAAIFTGVTAIFAALFIGLNSASLFRRQQSSVPLQTMKMVPLTNSGKSVCAAISPDGRYIAHAEEQDGKQELLLTGLATAGTSVVVPPSDVSYQGITFSRDGNYLYFTRTEKSDVGTLFQLALPGSAPRKIRDGVDSPITFSPNGDKFSFVRFNKDSREYSLMIAQTDGTGEQPIATRRDGDTFSVYGPAWSPDGTTVVCAAGWWNNGYHINLVEVDVASGHEKAVSAQQWFSVFQVAWLEDKSGLIISARELPTSPHQLWRISYPQGESVRITNDIAEYRGVSLSRDTIVSVRIDRVWKIWVVPDGDIERATASASGVGLSYGLNWTEMGKIVFSSMAQDRLNISLIDPDGSNQTQLTVNAGDNYTPATSPDGRFIVFASNRTGSFNLWRMNADDGSDLKQLTFSDGNFYPTCSPDGQWVLYDNQSNPAFTVWKVPIDGGVPIQLTDTDKNARMPEVSPDNQFIACRYDIEAGLRGIAIIPFQGGPPVKLLRIPIMDWQRVQWTPDGRALTYIDAVNGTSNIWSYDLDSRSTRQLTNFKSDQIFAYAWSPDYKQLACERGTRISDVTIINNLK